MLVSIHCVLRFKKKLLKSTPEYKNHKKRFQAGYFPSKSRKKNQKKSKILDSIEGSGSVTADCKFEKDTIQLGEQTKFIANSFSVQNINIAIELIGPNGSSIEKKDDFYANNTYEHYNIKPTSVGTFNYTLYAQNGVACSASLTVNPPTANCSVSSNSIEQGDKLTFKVNSMKPSSTNMSMIIKENATTERYNGTVYSNNEISQEWVMSEIGTFDYLVTLDGIEVCTQQVTVSPVAAKAETCQFSNSSRVYGEKVRFKVDKLKVANGTTWVLEDENGNEILNGTYSSAYSSSYWETNEFNAKSSGKYTLKLAGNEACSADLNVTQPSAENCKLDAETIMADGSTTFRWDLKNCKDNQCSYEIRVDDSYVTSGTNVSEQNDRQHSVNTAGEYVVWLNGVKTDCKKKLTVAASGSLTCSMAETLLVGEQWQKIKVVSTRLKDSYDIWIDGSIGKNSNGDDMINNWIESNATSEIGGFTCGSSGTHTYKITSHDKTTALCEGTFNCVNVPKVDCYFLKNSDWSAVSGSVLPNTQLQFCASKASANKQTTLTGQDKNGNINKGDFGLSKDNVTCHYFEAPSNDGSYTFKLSADGEEACKSNPVLVVKKPENMITLVYQGSLTTIEAGSWLIYSNNQHSGVMRCKSTSGEVNITVDGAIKTITGTLNSVEGAAPRTDVSVEVVIPVGKSIQCHTDW